MQCNGKSERSNGANHVEDTRRLVMRGSGEQGNGRLGYPLDMGLPDLEFNQTRVQTPTSSRYGQSGRTFSRSTTVGGDGEDIDDWDESSISRPNGDRFIHRDNNYSNKTYIRGGPKSEKHRANEHSNVPPVQRHGGLDNKYQNTNSSVAKLNGVYRFGEQESHEKMLTRSCPPAIIGFNGESRTGLLASMDARAFPPNSSLRLAGGRVEKTGQQRVMYDRDQFLRNRSNSNDSGYNERLLLKSGVAQWPAHIGLGNAINLTPNSGVISLLEAHQLSLSAPSTPVIGTPRKITNTSSGIRRQLKTITEGEVKKQHSLSRLRSLQLGSVDPSSDSDSSPSAMGPTNSDDEFSFAKSKKSSKSMVALNETGTDLSLNNRRTPREQHEWPVMTSSRSGRRHVGGSPSLSRIKKSKSLSSKLWPKLTGLKSAPTSPELARKQNVPSKV